MPERLLDVREVELTVGKGRELTRLDPAHERPEHLPDLMWTIPDHLLEVEGEEGEVLQEWLKTERSVLVEVSSPEFDEPPVGAECSKTRHHPRAGERIEHHIDAVAAGHLEDVVGEGK
jgi:hypothetical protein